MRRLSSILVVLALAGLPAVAGADGPVESFPPYGSVLAGLYPLDPVSSTTLDESAAWAGKPVTFGGLFHNTSENNAFSPLERLQKYTIWQLDQIWSARATPFSNVEMDYRAASIGAGVHDGEMRAWAAMLRRWLEGESVLDPRPPGDGRSVIVAPLQEMNGIWTGYGCYRGGGGEPVMEAAAYRAAFRRFVTLAREELGVLATQVRWAFAPNNVTSPGCGAIADYYPGDDVVDLIGISAFNFGTAVAGGTWQTPADVLDAAVDEVRSTVAADVPFLVAQTGSSSSGGDKDGWIRDLFVTAAEDPNVVGLVWFNADKDESGGFVDWLCCPERNPGWRDAMQAESTWYVWPLEEWFEPGPIPFRRLDRAPVAAPDVAQVVRARSVVIDAVGNDVDPDGFPLSAEVVTQPARGTVVILADGRLRYVHDGSPALVDSFTYRVSDGALVSDPVAVTIVVLPAPEMAGMFDPATGLWHLQTTAGTVAFYFGVPGDLPLAGDWDCDGIDTPGLYRQSDGYLYLRNANDQGTADRRFYVGIPGDIPVAGDFDGDGCDTVSVYRPTEARIYVVDALGADGGASAPARSAFYLGERGDRIFAGDFDGDGVDTLAVFRNGSVHLLNRLAGGPAEAAYEFGVAGDIPVAGDWTAVGNDAVGVVRISEGRFYLQATNGPGPASRMFFFGEPGWLPVTGDFGPGG